MRNLAACVIKCSYKVLHHKVPGQTAKSMVQLQVNDAKRSAAA